MVHEYYVNELKHAQRQADKALDHLKTKADAEIYLQTVRGKIATCFGALPERTALNPRITGVVERDAYTIEKVIFESRPRFYVTANLYLPKGAKAPAPSVVGPCGHADNAKAFGEYQSFAQGLARQGYVVLVYDPIGQGERLQFADEQLKSRVGVGSRGHLMVGNQQFLVGEFFGTWRGTIEEFERLRRIYSVLGAADQVKLYIGPAEHGYPRESREAMYAWFNRATRIRETPVESRILRPHSGRGYPLPRTSVYALETEPGLFVIVYRLGDTVLYSRPPKQTNRALLYVAHDSSDAELRDEPHARELLAAEPAATLYACDVRGLGESRPNTFGDTSYSLPSGSGFNLAIHAIMLDRPYVYGTHLF